MTPLFARQAIYDKYSNVIAYELLFRHSDDNYAQVIDGDHATSSVLLNSFGNQSIHEIIGNKKVFINFTESLLATPPPLPADRLVIEVLEDVKASDKVLESLNKLKSDGFDIALDDFFINKETKKMISKASIIKIDVLALSDAKLIKYVEYLKPLNIKLLAEKVEDHEMMQKCIDLGFDWFQGYYLCKPEVVKGVKISEAKHTVLRLLGVLNNASSTFDEIVDIIATDSKLSYKILSIVNSSSVGTVKAIESLKQAVAMLGIENIKHWANIILLASTDDKPKELCSISLTRAKFCEKLGEQFEGKELAESCFTTGLLSNLDAFVDRSKAELIKQLNLSTPIADALLHLNGLQGVILEIALHYERGQWDKIDWKKMESVKLDDNSVNMLYAESLSWATETLNAAVY